MRSVSDLRLQKYVLLPHELVPMSRYLKLGLGKIMIASRFFFFFNINGTPMLSLLLYSH